MATPVKVVGARGDWTASVGGDRLAVIHDYWWTPPKDYHDPMRLADIHGKRYADFVAALEAYDRVVMQKTAVDGSFARLGYVGIFRFADLSIAEDGAVSLSITERLPLRPMS